MRKRASWFLFLLSASLLTACKGGGSDAPEAPGQTSGAAEETLGGEAAPEETDITLWTFPVGSWGNPTAVGSLLTGFHKENPDIHVSVEYLSYENGDERIRQATDEKNLPDLVLEGPERLVAGWGAQGLMADLSDLWETQPSSQIYDNIREACRYSDGAYYEFPLCMTAHCMAINYDMFREAGALQYIDEENRTWTTEGFLQAVKALRDHGQEKVGAVYCKNQGGDQGTRALVTNLYGGSFTDEEHAAYTVDSEENIRALETLRGLEGITFEPSQTGVDAIDAFCRGEVAMTFCWNVSMEIQQTIKNPNLDFEIFPMAFPGDEERLEMPSGIWGFGVFDSGDERRVEAAKEFIRYMTQEDEVYAKAVMTSAYWPVRDVPDIYVNDRLMTEYQVFMRYTGDYYQITPDWSKARQAWWKLLQKIGEGTDVREAVEGFPAQE